MKTRGIESQLGPTVPITTVYGVNVYRPSTRIHNVLGEPVPLIGGITSRNLFQGMFNDNVDRGGIPNRLWLVTSIALLVSGLLWLL